MASPISFNTITDYVLRNVSTTAYYKSRFPEWDGRNGSQIPCPFHEDKTPSFSINIGTIGGCFCHAAGCRKKIGSIVHCEKEICNLQSDKDAARKLYAEYIHPVIEFDGEFCNIVTEHKTNLLDKSPDLIVTLQKELGFDATTIDRFHIGWDWTLKRFTFPIFNQWGDLINIRYYKAPSQRTTTTKFKIVNHTGFGSPASIFPLNIIEQTPNPLKTIYWLKAERDVMLAWSMGIPAFCTTGGEGDEPEKYIPYLKRLGFKVIICGDNDEAGLLAIQAKWSSLENTKLAFGEVRIPEGQKDFSDWIIKEKKTAADFYALPEISGATSPLVIPSSKPIHLPKDMVDATLNPLEGEYEVAHIGRRPELLNSAIEVKGVVSARLDRTYSIPVIVETCNKLYRIPISRELLQMVAVSDNTMQKVLQKILNTEKDIIFRQHITVTEIEIIPVLVPGQDAAYVSQKCFYFGENLECNLPYKLSVIPTSSMKTQETVGLIYEAEPLSNKLDNHSLTEEDIVMLQTKFSPDPEAMGEAIYLRMVDLSLEIATRHTGIYNRTDLHIAQLLTWCSPIQFNFHTDGPQRGWMNTLVLGDSRTGKSKIAESLRSLFQSGVFISSENCTFVGLIGGAIKCASGSFMLRWGKIPLYNRQLVAVEELSGLTCEDISKMSDVRSSGVARLDKGGLSGETSAKTRLLFISNVRRKHGNLSDFTHGVKAVQELVGQNEDVSRFDLILTVTANEVSHDLINKDRSKELNEMYTDEEKLLFQKLITFIWSLRPEQIEITEDAYRKCLEGTLELAKIYHASIPLFNASEGRLKLARIACAIAALQFSWDRQKSKLIVRDTHVRAAIILMKKFFNKPSLGYGKYSKQQFLLENVIEEAKLKRTVDAIFTNENAKNNFFRYLSNNGSFEKEEVNEALNLSSIFAERLISVLYQSNVIRRALGSNRIIWETTYPGRRWIEKNFIEH